MSQQKTEASTITLENRQSNPFEVLPKELIPLIQMDLEPCTEKERSLFSRTSRLFSSNQEARLTYNLLQCIGAGNQEYAQKLLITHPELAAKKATFTDWSGRTFYCSPFEYATWALDVRYMCPMMLDCLPINEQGEKLRINLLKQFNTLQEKGLSYTLNGETYTETHFSFAALKKAFQTCITQFNTWTWPQREHQWCKGVGKAQLLLPVHVRQHYCDTEDSFYLNTPTSDNKHFKRSLEFVNKVKSGIVEHWGAALSGLGVDFAITGSRAVAGLDWPEGVWPSWVG